MCGLVGVILKANNGFYKKHHDVFSQMIFADELRGADATGIIYAESDGGFGIMKEASPASFIADSMMNDKMLSASMRVGKVLLGHNRKATVGKIVDDTAHPFIVDDTFALQHNGTLVGHRQLADTEVDSEALAKHLKPVLGPAFTLESFEEAIGKVSGAFAVAAYNQENHTVYLTRNAQRPLSIIETHDAFYYASEMPMLQWILIRNSVAFKADNCLFLNEHHLVTFDLEKGSMEVVQYTPKKPIPVSKPITGTVARWIGTNSSSNANTHTKSSTMSKNEYKRFRRKYLGNSHTFQVEDFVECDFPNKLEDGAEELLLYGSFDGSWCDGIRHSIHAKVNVMEVFGSMATEDDVMDDNAFMFGRIYEMELGKDGKITFYLENIRKVKRVRFSDPKWNATTKQVTYDSTSSVH